MCNLKVFSDELVIDEEIDPSIKPKFTRTGIRMIKGQSLRIDDDFFSVIKMYDKRHLEELRN